MKPEVLLIKALLLVGSLGWSSAAAEENPLRFIRHEEATVLLDADIEVTAAPVNLNSSARWATVTWKNVPSPSKDDWIGLWALWDTSAKIDPSKHAPVKYQFCSVSETHLKTGAGQLKFYMVNMRSPFQFGLLRGGFKKPVLAANSSNIQFPNYNEPLQIHFSLAKNATEMVMTFVTLNSSSPEVKWGTVSGHLDNVEKATSSSYSATDMCDSPAKDYGFMPPGTISTVWLKGLTPGTKYYYQCGSADGGYSDEQFFMAPPTPGPNITTRILAFGDLGHGQTDDTAEVIHTQPPSVNTTKRMAAEVDNQDFVMHIGDIAYAEGFASTWEEFFDQLQPLMVRLPYMVNPGNHESDSKNSHSYYQGHDSGGECSVPYFKRFFMPREYNNKRWYGFEYGSVHVIMMSTEHDFRNTSQQWSDLVKLFEAVDRTRTPWLIFSGHRPMYVDSDYAAGVSSDQEVAKLLREHVEPLLIKNKVDLALWGHHHSYQRTCAVHAMKCTPGAPVHVVIGMAGQGLSQNIRLVKPPYFEVVDDQHYGYTRIVAGPTTLSMEFIKDADGSKGDSFSLPKKQ